MMQASDRGQHCPFLNRTDARCGTHFTLERLEHAFEYCFDRYTACPVYLELLVERRLRRGEESRRLGVIREAGEVEGGGSDGGESDGGEANRNTVHHEDRPLVEVTIHAKRFSKALPRIGAVAPKRAA